MSQDAALLQQILSEKIGTDGLIQMGTTQPYDLIRLYENPANATKLTNIGTDGLTTASTTVLVIDEGSARTGLTFEPDLSLLKHTGSDVKLLVSASVEQAVNVVLNHAGHTTTQVVTAPADKTAVLTIGLIAGIATVIGSHNFFDEAAAGNDSGGGESSGSAFDAAEFLNAAIDPDGWLRSLGGTTDINNDGEPETWLHLAGMTLPIPQSGSLMGQIVIPETIQYNGITKWLHIYGAESLFLPDGGNQPNRHSIVLPSPGTVAFTLTTSQLTLTVDAETVSYPVTANAKLCILVDEFAVDDAIRIVLQA